MMKKTWKRGLALVLGAALLGCTACAKSEGTKETAAATTAAATTAAAAESKETEAASAAAETDYPKDTIKVICSWAAGGQADVVCRILTDLLSKEMGATIIVENITGTGGQVAAIEYMNAESSGYELIYSSDVIRFLAPRVAQISYDPMQMVPLCTTASNGFGVIVNGSKGIKNLEDLKAYAADNSPLTCAVTGKTGAITYELMNALFKEMGVDVEFMVFDSGAAVASEVVGGHVDVGIAIDPLCDQYVQDGSVSYIASFLEDGHEIEGCDKAESCVAQGYDLTCANPNMLCAKAGTDQAIIDKLTAALENIRDDFNARCEELGYTPNMVFGEELDSYLAELDELYAGMAEGK